MAEDRFTMVTTAHVFLVRGNEVLLLQRHNTGYEDGNYSVVAGHLDGGETVKAAAMREAHEEVGVELVAEALSVVGVMHRKSDDERVDFFLAAQEWSGDAHNAEPDKCDELRWCPMDALPDNVIPYVRRAIENFRAGRWFDSYGWGIDA